MCDSDEFMNMGGGSMCVFGESMTTGNESMTIGGESMCVGGQTMTTGDESMRAGGKSMYASGESINTGVNGQVCSPPPAGDNGVGFTYNLTEASLLPFYGEVIAHTHLRVLIYNGDTDPGLNSFAAENWTSFLGGRNCF
jgi:hypothetical protein